MIRVVQWFSILSIALFTTKITLGFLPPTTTSTKNELGRLLLAASSSDFDEDGKCVFGKKSYWDDMYNGVGDRPSKSYSWYCGWSELKPFWDMIVDPTEQQQQQSPRKEERKVMVAGIGNDPAPIDLYDDGWTNMIAFDYSQAGIDRAKQLFGKQRCQNVTFLTADARDLPVPSDSVDATLDKGTLDAIYITGKDVLQDSVHELTRVTAENGVVVSVSTVIPPEELLQAFESSSSSWENIHNGELAFAPDGEATIDLGAEFYSWRKVSGAATSSTPN